MKAKMKSEIPVFKYSCPKCGNRSYVLKEIRVTYSPATQIFNFPFARYSAVVCDRCKYTEFYNVPLKKISTITDFFGRG